MNLKTIHELESKVRAGQFRDVARLLREIKIKHIPRNQALAFANIASRVGQPNFALRILNPIIRNEKTLANPATDPERIHYANCLRQLGAIFEAIEILEKIDRKIFPQAGLQLAFCYISQWQYQFAIPLLREFIDSFSKPDYGQLVAKVNLLAALIHEEDAHRARQVLKELHDGLDAKAHPLLFGNSLELAAQLEILDQNWSQATSYLKSAQELLTQAQGSQDATFITKWLAITRSLKTGRVETDLLAARELALRLGHWEIVRECDFFIAKISRDIPLLTKLYFGTPYESYRAKILRSTLPHLELPEFFEWKGSRTRGKTFDLQTAMSTDRELQASPGQSVHKMFIIMCQDFYKPIPLLSIFSKLFAGEHFSPETSAGRAHQTMRRLRAWIKDASLPLEVEELSGGYRLKFTGAFTIRIPQHELRLEQKDLEFLRLRRCLKHDSFNTQDVVRSIDTSKSAAKRLLKWAVDNGKAESQGWGKSSRYKFVG